MRQALKASIGSALLAVAIGFSGSASAADLGGSMKDTYMPAGPAPVAAGPCYFRADMGYSWSKDPGAEYVGNIDPRVSNTSLDNGWLAEAGIGCGSGSRGVRGELMFGMRQTRGFSGYYTDFTPPVPIDPLLETSIKSYTMMVNGYYDLGRIGNAVPYVGAGVGLAYHKMNDITSDVSPNTQFGAEKVSFAWALMAGVGFQLTDRAILDIGYRYSDLGSATSSHGDVAFAWNPRLAIDDLRSHEVKIGLRYHFGTSGDCCGQVPLK